MLQTTDGEIAVINLDSARWVLETVPSKPTAGPPAETVIEHEQITAQFLGDLSALDRLEFLIANCHLWMGVLPARC